jgi:outer membrane protein TolC
MLCSVILASGCTRAFYRRWADRETYDVTAEHADERRWPISNMSVIPPPESRLFDPFNPDRPPMPPDDPPADRFMMWPNGIRNSRHFHDDGDAPFIEASDWRQPLELDADGKLQLTQEKAVELGVLNSREYQTALENLYLTSLALTLNRFEFDCHWFLTNNTVWTHFGSSDTEINTLSSASTFGFTRNLYAGGQLMAEFANNLLVTFSGVDQTIWSSNLIATFTQPLLRGAGRRVRLEGLTQAERNVLYAVRNFARFRKQFYVSVATSQNTGYLGLLLQMQNLRNLEANVKSNDQNFRLHEALFDAQIASTIQVDQAFQNLSQAKLSQLQAQANLQTSLDQFNVLMGLPPSLPVTLDDSILKPFQLVDPALEKLQGEVDVFFSGFRSRTQPPSLAVLCDGFTALGTFHEQALKLLGQAETELKQWRARLGAGVEDSAQLARERDTYQNLEKLLPDIHRDFDRLAKELAKDVGKLDEPGRQAGWTALLNRSRTLVALLDQVFVLQTQIRVYLIQLKPILYRLEEAEEFARNNRLDLMNQRAQVTDAWRQIAVTASALKAGLNVTATANVATKPGADAPFDFRACASTYTVGFQFDGPLNRLAERNLYRASQINYQQARRSFMALGDQIDASIRQDLRTLELERANFAIARLQLISAARGLEASRDSLLIETNVAASAATLNILNALNALLQAKSQLINSWISYESTRVQLLLDMDALQLTPRGVPTDEPDDDPDLLPYPTPVFPGQPIDTSAVEAQAGRRPQASLRR